MKRALLITILLTVVAVAFAHAAYYTGDKETKYFLAAKGYVFDREWDKAQARLESYIKRYPDGRFEEEARYWLARSLNQMSRDAKRTDEVIRLKKRAIENVDLLLGKFPDSVWKDDARALRVEIAAQLALLGIEEYQKYIEKILREEDAEASQLKWIAVEAWAEFDPEIAIPMIEDVLNRETDPDLRRRAVTLIGAAHGKEALPLLRHLEEEDADPEVRKLAAHWSRKAEMRAIPVYLSYFGYVARVKNEDDQEHRRRSEGRNILEDKLNVFEFPVLDDPDKKDVEKALKRMFRGTLDDIRFAANNTVGLDLGGEFEKYVYSMHVSHNLAGFRVSVAEESIEKSHFDIRGKASFFDKFTDREYLEDFMVDRDDAWLMAMRHGEEVALLVLIFESSEEPVEEDDEPEYYTQINNVFGSMVHSSRQTWDMEELDAAVVEYGRAKAEIPGDGGTWVLIGHIQLHRKAKQFVGRDARLYDPQRKVVAEALEIVVPVEAPDKYEVKGKDR